MLPTCQVLKNFGGLDQEKVVAMYNSLSEEFKSHKKRLESALAVNIKMCPTMSRGQNGRCLKITSNTCTNYLLTNVSSIG